MTFTVDASIVVKWYIEERHLEEARLLLAHRLGRHAPDFLLVEFANTVSPHSALGYRNLAAEVCMSIGTLEGFS